MYLSVYKYIHTVPIGRQELFRWAIKGKWRNWLPIARFDEKEFVGDCVQLRRGKRIFDGQVHGETLLNATVMIVFVGVPSEVCCADSCLSCFVVRLCHKEWKPSKGWRCAHKADGRIGHGFCTGLCESLVEERRGVVGQSHRRGVPSHRSPSLLVDGWATTFVRCVDHSHSRFDRMDVNPQDFQRRFGFAPGGRHPSERDAGFATFEP